VLYVVRPYVRGVAITTFCRRRVADRKVRRQLVATVQQIVVRTHARVITHGNLTAANLLVSGSDSAPIVTIADFGMRAGSKEADLAAIERLTAAPL